MGAAACSDADRVHSPEKIDRGLKAPLPNSLAQNADHWHDKMKLSTASQALFEGAQCGDTRRVLAALNAHGDPNCVNFAGYTALMMAVGGCYKEVVALLLQASANPNYNLAGLSALMIAAASGQLEVTRMLVNCGASSSSADVKDGSTALHRACSRGFPELVGLLAQAGASVDAGDLRDRTAMMVAAEAGHEDVIRVLLSAGASMSRSDKDGETALIKAVRHGHEAVLEAMLKAGSPVNAVVRTTGDSALAVATRSNNEPISRRLLQFQANVNLPNQLRETPLILAAMGGHAKVAHLLLLAGADTTFQDLQGHTALMSAAAFGSAAVCSVLLDFAGDPSAVSPLDANTPLTMAAAHGHSEAYAVLVAAGGVVRATEGAVEDGSASTFRYSA